MDFSGLYDPKRHLFHIGLRVEDQALDASYYDLLASESRLTSFLAIAKGDVPKRHWSALGRPFLSVDGAPGLKSWSGSMFEYLMPSLLMHEPAHGLLQTMAALGHSRAARFRLGAAPALGRFRIGLFCAGPFAGLPVLALWRAAAWRCGARR